MPASPLIRRHDTQPLIHGGLIVLAGTTEKIEAGALPKRLVVAPWGSHSTAKGQITINERTVAHLPGNQARSNFDRIALDFNHNTVPGSESYRGEPAKIAAHGTPRVQAGEGISMEALDWTPEGREFVGGNHYIDLSPTLQLNAAGEAVFIHSAAVCRQGAIPGLALFAADPLGRAYAEDGALKELLAMVLGIPASSSEDEIKAAARQLHTSMGVTIDQLLYDKAVAALSEKGSALDANIKLLSAVFDVPEQDVVEEAVFKRLGISDRLQRKMFLAAGVSADSIRRYAADSPPPTNTETEAELFKRICSRLGITPEQAAKYSK